MDRVAEKIAQIMKEPRKGDILLIHGPIDTESLIREIEKLPPDSLIVWDEHLPFGTHKEWQDEQLKEIDRYLSTNREAAKRMLIRQTMES